MAFGPRSDAVCRLLSSGLWATPNDWSGSTVGSGIGPDLLTPRMARALAGSCPASIRTPTAGGEFHPALKTFAGNAGGRSLAAPGRSGLRQRSGQVIDQPAQRRRAVRAGQPQQ